METPEEFRRKADETEELARHISLRSDREKMLQIASRLRRWADELEAKDRRRARKDPEP